jgi:hypothetical protein
MDAGDYFAYQAGMASQGAGRALGGMLGMQTPEQAKQDKIEEIMGQYGEGTKSYEQLMQIADSFRSANMPDLWQEVMDMADKMKPTASSDSDTRGNIQKGIEYFATEINGCNKLEKGTTEYSTCMKKSVDDAADYKRLNPGIDVASKGFRDLSKETYAAGSRSLADISKYKRMLDILPDITTGPVAGSLLMSAKAFGSHFGFDVKDTAKMEEFRSKAMTIALGFVNDTKGAVSDREFAAFLEAAPSLATTEAGNEILLQGAKILAEWKYAKSLEMARWEQDLLSNGRTPTQGGWVLNFKKWSEDNPLEFSGVEARIDTALGRIVKSIPSSSDGSYEPLDLDAVDAWVHGE